MGRLSARPCVHIDAQFPRRSERTFEHIPTGGRELNAILRGNPNHIADFWTYQASVMSVVLSASNSVVSWTCEAHLTSEMKIQLTNDEGSRPIIRNGS